MSCGVGKRAMTASGITSRHDFERSKDQEIAGLTTREDWAAQAGERSDQPLPVARGAFRAATVWRTRSQQPGGHSSNSQRPSGAGGAALPMMQSII